MPKKLGFYITLFFLSLNGLAQPYLSVRGDFSVDQRRGCTGLFVTVTNIRPGDGVILYQYEGTTSPVTDLTNYTYNNSGGYWLYQYIQGGMAGTRADSIFIEVLDPEIVDFELESCNNNQVVVRLQNSTYDSYEIDYGDGTVIQVPFNGFAPPHLYNTAGPFNVSVAGVYSTATNRCGTSTRSYTPVTSIQPAFISAVDVIDNATIVIDYTLAMFTSSSLEIALNGNPTFQTLKSLNQGTSRDTLTGLNLNNTYCLRIASNDACSNFKSYSNEVCSVVLSLTAVSDAIQLGWQTEFTANFSMINILRDASSLQTLSNTDLNYTDSTVVCNIDYCYRVEVTNSDGSISSSQTECETAFSTTNPAPVSNISTSIDNEIVSWSWVVPPGEGIGNFRITNENGFVVGNTDQTTITQELEDPTECLQWQFTNDCGNTSALSALVCPLEVTYVVNAEGSTNLSWNAYEGWENGTAGYAVLIFDLNFNQLDSIWVGTDTAYEDPIPDDDNQVSFYRIIAQPVDGSLLQTRSNLLMVEREPIISLPTSFTPDGDGLNDIFEIVGKYIMSQELTIINRWGSTVFSSTTEGWDGTSLGEKVPMGTYVYQARIKDFTGKEHIRTGTVLILKD